MVDSVSSSSDTSSTKGTSSVGGTTATSEPSAKDTAQIEAAVAKESPHAEAALLTAGDSFDAPSTPKSGDVATVDRPADDDEVTDPAAIDPAAATTDPNMAPVDPEAAVTDPAVAPAEISEATYQRVEALDAEMRGLQWSASPEAAQTTAAQVREVVSGLPADQRREVLDQLMAPVTQVAQSGLNDPATQLDRIAAVGAFSDLVGQPVVDALAGQLRNQAESGNVPARDALARTLNDIGRTNQDVDVQRSAARTLLNGPHEVIRDGLAGRIDGLGVEQLAHLSRTRGDVETDQRLRGLAGDLDPAVMQGLEANGIRHQEISRQTPEIVHTLLDVAGLFPLFGEPADLLNAELYRRDGQYIDAAISAGGALTGLGMIGTGGRLAGRLLGRADDAGDAARIAGEAREIAAERALQGQGLSVRRWNHETGNTDIDLYMESARGRTGILVGGDAKGLRNGQIDEATIQSSLQAFRRADEALLDPDGVFRADGLGAVMAFPRTTDPRVLDRFIQELGAQRVLLF